MGACFSEVASELKQRRRYLVTVIDVVASQCAAWFILERVNSPKRSFQFAGGFTKVFPH
jgi:hypothetical protein